MRALVWTCRLVMAVVAAAFVATIFYMTHKVGTQMDVAKPTLNLVAVIGAGLIGIVWPLMRRYWQALVLLVSLGVFRGLFGTNPGLTSLTTPLATPFQSDYLWFSMGAIVLALLATLIGRAIASDRRLRSIKHGVAAGAPAPAPRVTPPAPVIPSAPATAPASLVPPAPSASQVVKEAEAAVEAKPESKAEDQSAAKKWGKKK